MSSTLQSERTLDYTQETAAIQAYLMETPYQPVTINLDAELMRQIVGDCAQMMGLTLPRFLISSIKLTACYRSQRYGAHLEATFTAWRNGDETDKQDELYNTFGQSYTAVEWEVFRQLVCSIVGTRYLALAALPKTTPNITAVKPSLVILPELATAGVSAATLAAAAPPCTLTAPATETCWVRRCLKWCKQKIKSWRFRR